MRAMEFKECPTLWIYFTARQPVDLSPSPINLSLLMVSYAYHIIYLFSLLKIQHRRES